MKNPMIEKSIHIKATVDQVWSVFADPAITQKIGGFYVTDWEIGSSFDFKGNNGSIYTNGKILELIPGKLLKHQLYDLIDNDRLLSTITYEFKSVENSTLLTATEELNEEMDNQHLTDVNIGWDAALQTVKNIAEGL